MSILAKLILFLSVVLYLIVLYISMFTYKGVINLNYLLLAICLLALASYKFLNHQRKQDNSSIHKSIRTLYIFILIFIIVSINYIRYLPKFTYIQAYEIIKEDLSKDYLNLDLVQERGKFSRDYPYNFFSNKTYNYTIIADGEEKNYLFNQYTGEHYEIEGNEGTIYRKY